MGCASGEVRYQSADFPGSVPGSVAVLPFDNEAMEFSAPDLLRRLVEERLVGYGYTVLSRGEVDEKLQRMGVSEGGQLGAFTPEAVGVALGTDGLMYGSVEEFVYQNVGFVRKRKVRLRLRLVHASKGEKLWEDAGEGTRVKVAFDKKEAGRSFLEGVIEQASEKLWKVPLLYEAKKAVDRVLRRYPRRH